MTDDGFRGTIGESYRDSQSWKAPGAEAPAGAPNVLLIVLDDVGFAHLGCYGSSIDTPHIDRLAAGGRRYNNFHTTAMCSPTRASLLTGRNHHAVGMGMIVDWCTGFPGYQGQVTRRAATLAEMLRPAGYNCHAIGKWHLARLRDHTAAGPYDHWPLGRGFERYYGFLGALTDHWNPELICDNHPIPTPRREGYHLTEDLVDQTIAMIRDQQAAAPGKPFFSYLALGACHSPHHAPRACIDKYRGRFDEGWDVARKQWHARQLELGIVPSGTRLAPRDSGVRAWSSMTPDERRLCARHQEVFAGFLDHTDAQIGRLIGYLESRKLLANTLVVLLSDNGATAEGGAFGDINIRRHYQFLDESFEEKLAEIDRLGGERLFSNYPRGWGCAGNTPLKRYKMHTHGGGIRDPLIIHWPERIRQGGLISPQFCHSSDIAPTILEAAGIAAPASVQGIPQMEIQGTSLAYTFAEPLAATRKPVQYFELMGNRGIWADGWKAVTHHEADTPFEQDRWELYDTRADFSECEDLAARHPERLKALVDLWWAEARRNHVLPLDDRGRERALETYWPPRRERYVLEQGGRLAAVGGPPVAGNSWRIVADVELDAGARGVILSAGGCSAGYALFMQGGRLAYEYNGPGRRWFLESGHPIERGRHLLTFDFRQEGSGAGRATLLCDGAPLETVAMSGLWPYSPHGGSIRCGYHDGSPVSERDGSHIPFSGRILEVAIEVDSDGVPDPALQEHALISED
ncbi:MAG: arylsulfatase [Burkholderiales bacterium]|nr:arylsulfatase [Burkholderiales bacterium]